MAHKYLIVAKIRVDSSPLAQSYSQVIHTLRRVSR